MSQYPYQQQQPQHQFQPQPQRYPYPYQQPPQRPPEQMIRLYKDGWVLKSSAKRFRHDATKLARQGWRVQSQSSERVGWMRRGITVVYVR